MNVAEFERENMVTQIAAIKSLIAPVGIIAAGWIIGPWLSDVINEGTSISLAVIGPVVVTTVGVVFWIANRLNSMANDAKEARRVAVENQKVVASNQVILKKLLIQKRILAYDVERIKAHFGIQHEPYPKELLEQDTELPD